MKIMRYLLFSLLICPAISYSGELLTTGKNAAGIFINDGYRIVSSPFRMTRKQVPATVGVMSIILFSSCFDRLVYENLKDWESRDLDRIHTATEPFGRVWRVRDAGALVFLGGLATRNSSTMKCGAECLEASFYATHLVVFFKNATGRLRPGTSTDPYQFYPFSKGNALPSSHATQAFAAASVFSEYTPVWADWLLYSVSSTVAFFDMYKNRHWISDIVAGSVLGYFMGKSIVHGHKTMDLKSEYRVNTHHTTCFLRNNFLEIQVIR